MQALAMVWPILCCVQISECRPQDLDVLGAAMPSVSPRAHYLRFERQLAGQSTILIAWVDGVPAGHAEVRWDGNDVGDPFPHCPQVNAMEVWPPERRSQGIGTALIAAAERRALARGLGQLGLGVADTNRRAADLYLRLGFRETGCRFFDHHEVRDRDRTRWVSEPCRFLVKTLG
jgi:GNAT superfamily N-acetyltransferase